MVVNKKAQFNYEIKDTLETGVVLTGGEVKSVRDNRVDLKDSFVKVIRDELWLVNADIARYKFDSDTKYNPTRSRKLLVHRQELNQLESKSKQWGGTLVPLKMYFKRGRVKVLIGIGRGRKNREKRKIEKERDLNIDLHREKIKYMVK